MTEYEIKFIPIDPIDIKKRLVQQDFKCAQTRFLQKRVIFNNSTTINNNRWLRLRDEGDKVTLALKEVTDEHSIEGTQEIETEVGGFEETRKILIELGMNETNYQENYRETWVRGDVTCTIDEWPQLEPLIEIEGTSKELVEQTARELNFTISEGKYGSIDILYQERNNTDILSIKKLTF